eukprot:5291321-Prymnesium_polylepis.1
MPCSLCVGASTTAGMLITYLGTHSSSCHFFTAATGATSPSINREPKAAQEMLSSSASSRGRPCWTAVVWQGASPSSSEPLARRK